MRSARLGAVLAFAFASACTHATREPEAAPPPKDSDRVGYVEMSALVKVHPLYPELSRLDDDMAALQLKSVGTNVAVSPQEFARATRELQRELDTATARAKAELKRKQDEYAKREQAAIAAAVAAAGAASGPGGGAIASNIAATAAQQAQGVTRTAQANLDRYRQTLGAQNEQAFRGLQRAVAARADRTYRAKLEELQRKEADFALQQASADSSQRLSLRTKLSNLVLDDEEREATKKQLDDLDRKEADTLAAMKNRDQATLAELETQLRAQSRAQLDREAATMRTRTMAKINERALQTREDVVGQLGALPKSGGVAIPAAMSPDMRNRLTALHQKYQADFTKDANTTIAQFQKTRNDLTKRFQALQGVDAQAQAGARRQLDALARQRSDLYGQIVAQINREVKTIATRRGIAVVIGDAVAPADGVDLTADAEKDIESLHE